MSCKRIQITPLLQASLFYFLGCRHIINFNDKSLPQKWFLSRRNKHLLGTLRACSTNIIHLLLSMIYSLSLWPAQAVHVHGPAASHWDSPPLCPLKHTPLNWHAHGQLSKHVWKIWEGSLSIIPSMWTHQKCTAQMREKGKEFIYRFEVMGQVLSSRQIYHVQPGGMFTMKMQDSPRLCGSSNLFNCLYLLKGSPWTKRAKPQSIV